MPAIGPAIAWIVILLLLSTYIAAWIGHLRVPYTVGLVLAGIVLGAVGVLPATTFNPDLVLLVLLPPLLFEAAYALELDRLRRVAVAMVSLATAGVILSAVITAAIAVVALQLSVGDAAILGVLVAATDPVAVIAFFREAKVDRDLVTLVEGESLLNDGTVVVLVSAVVAWLGRGQISVPGAIGQVLLVSLGGIAVGGLVGFAGAVMTPRRDDYLLEATISLDGRLRELSPSSAARHLGDFWRRLGPGRCSVPSHRAEGCRQLLGSGSISSGSSWRSSPTPSCFCCSVSPCRPLACQKSSHRLFWASPRR